MRGLILTGVLCLAGGLGSVPAGLAAPAAAAPVKATPQTVLDQLLAVDRAFSKQSSQTGGLSAFEMMFDDDVVLFARPVATFSNGKRAALDTLGKALGTPASKTEWTPVRGGISADGVHGFTVGFMVTRNQGGSPSVGKYLAYWIKRPGGWRVAVYKRSPRPEGDVSMAMMPPSLPSRMVAPVSSPIRQAIDIAILGGRERAFSDDAGRSGLGPAFDHFGQPDSMNLGGDANMIFGVKAVAEAETNDGPSPFIWAPDQGVLVASSGDLGATWGYLHRTGAVPPGRLAVIPFFTVWRRNAPDQPWLYIAE